MIVSGIAESSSGTDDSKVVIVSNISTLNQLLRAVSESGNYRPSSTSGTPRRLLVRLHHEESAVKLLRSAQTLLQADDPEISGGVYINPDLTPAAAKLALEERQRRRQRKLVIHRNRSNGEINISDQTRTTSTPGDLRTVADNQPLNTAETITTLTDNRPRDDNPASISNTRNTSSALHPDAPTFPAAN